MAEEIGIVMTLYDKVSPTLKAIAGNSKAFDKTLDELEASLKAYDQGQATMVARAADLKKALSESSVKVQEAQKSYRKLKDETSKGALDEAIEEQTRLKEQLAQTEAAIKANDAAYRELYKSATDTARALSKAENRAGTGGGSGDSGGKSSLSSAWGSASKFLVAVGMQDLLSSSAETLSNTIFSSQYGDAVGNQISSTLSGAISGGISGSAAGLPGIVVGGIVGGLSGYVQASAENYENIDAAFADYYTGLHDDYVAAAAEALSSGSDTARQRELDKLAFQQLLGAESGVNYLNQARILSNSTPLEYQEVTDISRALATGFGDDPEWMLELVKAIGDAGSAVGVSSSDMTIMAQALSRMQSSDKATLEYLNILQDRGVNVIGMLAEAMDKTQGEIYEMISNSEIKGRDAVEIIAAGMVEQFGGAMERMAETFDGLNSTLEDTVAEIDAAGGEAYNDARSEGIQAEIDAYGGELGEALSELSAVTGANQAYLENLSEQYKREALSAVLLGDDTTLYNGDQADQLEEMRQAYVEAKEAYEAGDQEAGLRMESLKEQAETLATAAYDSSEAATILHQTELDTIDALRDNTAALRGWYNTIEAKGHRSMGLLATETGFNFGEVMFGGFFADLFDGSHAAGLQRVPYDNYAAILHQGERILTAREAREQDMGERVSIQVNVTGNSFGDGSPEAVAAAIADALERKLAAGVR